MTAARLARAFARDRRGTAAVEFAVALPVLALLWLGMVELSNYLTTSRKLVSATQTMADLTGQEDGHSAASLDGILTAGRLILSPLPVAGRHTAVIASIGIDSTNTASVFWTYPAGATIPAEAVAQAQTMAGRYESVIYVRASYHYMPGIGWGVTSAGWLTEDAFIRPRTTRQVLLNGQARVP